MEIILLEQKNYQDAALDIIASYTRSTVTAMEKAVLLKVAQFPDECIERHKKGGDAPLAKTLASLNRKLGLEPIPQERCVRRFD